MLETNTCLLATSASFGAAGINVPLCCCDMQCLRPVVCMCLQNEYGTVDFVMTH